MRTEPAPSSRGSSFFLLFSPLGMTSQCCVSEYMAPLALCSIAGTETAASDGAGKKVDKDQVRQSQLGSETP